MLLCARRNMPVIRVLMLHVVPGKRAVQQQINLTQEVLHFAATYSAPSYCLFNERQERKNAATPELDHKGLTSKSHGSCFMCHTTTLIRSVAKAKTPSSYHKGNIDGAKVY